MRGGRAPVALLWALALAAWVCVHASGVHATVAGIVLGLLVPVTRRAGASSSFCERFEHRLHPLSAGFVVSVFALGAAGIPLAAAGDVLFEPVALGNRRRPVARQAARDPRRRVAGRRAGLGRLPDEVRWADVVPVAVLGGVGYTVSLLIAGLAFDQPALADSVGAAVLIGSTAAAAVAVALLRRRPTVDERAHRSRQP